MKKYKVDFLYVLRIIQPIGTFGQKALWAFIFESVLLCNVCSITIVVVGFWGRGGGSLLVHISEST